LIQIRGSNLCGLPPNRYGNTRRTNLERQPDEPISNVAEVVEEALTAEVPSIRGQTHASTPFDELPCTDEQETPINNDGVNTLMVVTDGLPNTKTRLSRSYTWRQEEVMSVPSGMFGLQVLAALIACRPWNGGMSREDLVDCFVPDSWTNSVKNVARHFDANVAELSTPDDITDAVSTFGPIISLDSDDLFIVNSISHTAGTMSGYMLDADDPDKLVPFTDLDIDDTIDGQKFYLLF